MAKQRSQSRLASRRTKDNRNLIRISVWTGSVIVIGFILFLCAFGIERLFFSKNPHFTLKKIDVSIAKGAVNSKLIKEKLELKVGKENIYDIDIEYLRNKLLKGPIIQDVEVRRIIPGTIQINVFGRTPVAQLLYQGGKTIDIHGYIMPNGTDAQTHNLPVLTGIPNANNMTAGMRLTDKLSLKALEFLKIRASMKNGEWLYVKLIQCNSRDDELIVYLHANNEHRIRENAKIIYPAKGVETAMKRVMRILDLRSIAAQPTGLIIAKYDRVPVTP